MEGSLKDLSEYRLGQALEALSDSKTLLASGSYKASINRSYYAIFHALRAVTALDSFDSSKHSGIIAYFNQHYVKEGVFDKDISKRLDKTFRLREKADYEDFYIASETEAQEQIDRAKSVISDIKCHLEKRWQ